jgi:hypothetical protein
MVSPGMRFARTKKRCDYMRIAKHRRWHCVQQLSERKIFAGFFLRLLQAIPQLSICFAVSATGSG